MREAKAREKSLESGIASIGVPLGIDGQKDEMDVARGVSPVEPFEDLVSFAEACMHECQRIGWHVPLARHRGRALAQR